MTIGKVKSFVLRYASVAMKAVMISLFIATVALGYLYNNSLDAISDLRSTNQTLEGVIADNNVTILRLKKEQELIKNSQIELELSYTKIEDQFEPLIQSIGKTSCTVKKKEINNENTNDDLSIIANYYRLYDRAYCLSTNSCDNP
jgi:hypothetical protein